MSEQQPDPLTLQLDAASHGVFLVGDGVEGILSLRAAGDMRQPTTRAQLIERLGLPGRVVSTRQIHSRVVVAADQVRGGEVEADGVATDAPGDVLLVTVADCLPIYFAAANGAMALVHSGCRGTGIALEAS